MRLIESTFVLLVFSAMVACATIPSENEMNYLGSALTKVSAAVDATARFKRSADSLIGAELLQTSTAHDPGLMKPFKGYTVRVLREGKDTAVLICEPNNGQVEYPRKFCAGQEAWRRCNASRLSTRFCWTLARPAAASTRKLRHRASPFCWARKWELAPVI